MNPEFQSSAGSLDQSRREFLTACATLGLAGCGVAANSRLARRALVTPEPEQWQPILRALTETIVAFDHPRFPRSVRVEQVESALFSHFPLQDGDGFAALRTGLWVFDDTALFPERLEPFLENERKLGAAPREIDRAVARDAEAFRRASVSGSFSELALNSRRRYLNLWAKSALTPRRRFYRAGKILIMLSAYSLPEMWAAIGYEGPLLPA